MRLESTRKSELAVRALIELDRAPTLVKGADLAETVCASAPFMAQVMALLVKEGWVASDPGPTGGYRLTIELTDISVLELVETIEGPTDTGLCVAADRSCDEDGVCALHHAWVMARETLRSELAASSLAAVEAGQSNTPLKIMSKGRRDDE